MVDDPNATGPKATDPIAVAPKANDSNAAFPKSADPNTAVPKAADASAAAQKAADANAAVPGATDPSVTVPKAKTDWSQLLSTVLFGVIALAMLGIIGWGLSGKQGFLDSLKDIPVTRGLITFLIAITTMGIAIMLAISTIFGTGGPDEDKRFDRGKQVLSVLIGLLGTIVGFYFGSSQATNSGQTQNAITQPQALAITPATLSNSQPKKGEKFTISFSVSGGKAPYSYSITFDPSIIPEIKETKSPDGVVKQEVAVPATLDADKDVKYQISVKDSDNKTAEYNKDGTQKISLKVK